MVGKIWLLCYNHIMTKCKICGRKFKAITNTHLKSTHNSTLKSYVKQFGSKDYKLIAPNLLPKNDIRFKNWKESLKKRKSSWCSGHSKETHPSILKISKTFKKKKIDNFSDWRKQMKEGGKWNYPELTKSGDLAELIGVVLGDGHICKFPRTESLAIFSNANNPGFVERYDNLLERIFKKKPYVAPSDKEGNCIRIRIYQKNISKRLGIPTGARKDANIKIPQWILKDKAYLIRCLRGLYEAEGSFSVHLPTSTYKFIFSNYNKTLLDFVQRSIQKLGFYANQSGHKVQISRKEEVYKCKDLIRFRKY